MLIVQSPDYKFVSTTLIGGIETQHMHIANPSSCGYHPENTRKSYWT
jgi:hypothetical protein